MNRNLALLEVSAVIQKRSALNKELANLHNTFQSTFGSVKNHSAYP